MKKHFNKQEEDRIFQLVVFESTLLSVFGGILGIGFGFTYLAFSGMSVAAEGVSLTFRPTVELLTVGVAMSLMVGLLAGVAPGLQAARTRIVNSLRQAG